MRAGNYSLRSGKAADQRTPVGSSGNSEFGHCPVRRNLFRPGGRLMHESLGLLSQSGETFDTDRRCGRARKCLPKAGSFCRRRTYGVSDIRLDDGSRSAPLCRLDGHRHGVYLDVGRGRLLQQRSHLVARITESCGHRAEARLKVRVPIMAYAPIAACSALAIVLTCRSMASSDSASTITRANFSVPE